MKARIYQNPQREGGYSLNLGGLEMGRVEKLIEKLNDNYDTQIRIEAIRKLGKIKNKRAVMPLINTLNDEDINVRNESAKALIKIGKRAVIPLINTLRNENQYIRMVAAWVLGQIKDKRAVIPLIDALKTKNSNEQRIIAWALGELGIDKIGINEKVLCLLILGREKEIIPYGSEAVRPLIDALNNEEPNVRLLAAWALGKLNDERAVLPLIFTLEDETDLNVQNFVEGSFEDMLEACKSFDDIQKLENKLNESLKILKKGNKDKGKIMKAKFEIAKLKMKIAEKKNELAGKKDILLPDKPKPPKKGQLFKVMQRKIRIR
jgi:HEAT repeat protein